MFLLESEWFKFPKLSQYYESNTSVLAVDGFSISNYHIEADCGLESTKRMARNLECRDQCRLLFFEQRRVENRHDMYTAQNN